MTEKILYQRETLGALMAGLMDGTEAIAHILEKGILGLGTLHGPDDKIISLDDVVHQERSDGSVVQLDGGELTPYAAITDFTPGTSFSISESTDGEQLKKDISIKEDRGNLFLTMKTAGSFKNMHIRIIPKQEKPYRRLVKISEPQPEFQQDNIHGALVEFFTPELFQGVTAAEFHLHFVDDIHTFGGHIVGFEVTEGNMEINRISSLVQHSPVDDLTSVHETIDYADLVAEIQQAEQKKTAKCVQGDQPDVSRFLKEET